ncbi:WD40 repeat domain-containing protein [Leucothrix arctica]|uniref:Uncharacterized protein n=1 Tax=Leucothrix arctica TaxID=1481894 RepID=A0A317CNL9_9GAMM|nr:WD40 repeat domain-containing protein [Leucothrix arctica]PWQ97912.1 hypothetical protein DKT75_05460 [Leucothrix arctica]
MLKNILQKNNIGLGIGLMVLLVNQGAARPQPPVSIQQVAFSNDSSQVLYLSNYSTAKATTINFVSLKTGETTVTTPLSVKSRIMGFTPDGFKTAVLEPKGLSILHNKTGKVLRTLKVPSLPWPNQYVAGPAITNKSGTAQLFHSANKRVLSVVHTGNGRVLAAIKLPTGTLSAMGISQNGRTVAYIQTMSAAKSQLHLYDTYQKKVTKILDLATQSGQTFNVDTISFGAKGKYLLVGTNLVDLTTDGITKITRSDDTVPATFTPNGRFLLVSFGNNQLLRYDLSSKQKKGISLSLPNNCRPSQAADISPNGQLIAYGSRCSRGNNGAGFISILNAADGSFMKKLTLAP